MDERIVYGAGCTWWDSIANVAKLPSGLPCCPHCKKPLFEMDSIEEWEKSIDAYETQVEPGYRAFIMWCRGKCFPDIETARHSFKIERNPNGPAQS